MPKYEYSSYNVVTGYFQKTFRGDEEMKFTVGKKIGGGFFAVLLLMAVIAAQGLLMANITNTDLNDVDTRFGGSALIIRFRTPSRGRRWRYGVLCVW